MDLDAQRHFPLREAYAFAQANGLATEAAAIKDMEIEWDRSYTSSVRKGRMIRLFEKHALLSSFIANPWSYGATPRGDTERLRCLRIADEYDAFLEGRSPIGSEAETETEGASAEFALEAHLRDFLAKNLEHIEPGLRLYEVDGKRGIEFAVDGGRIDLLAIDKGGKFVVIELKLSQGRTKALGQLLYYMGWVDRNLHNGPCRGVVIASDIADELRVAVERVPGVTLSRYRMSFSIDEAK